MLRTMLVPTDLGHDGDLVVRFACGLPALGIRRVVLAHVVDTSGMEGPVIATRVDHLRAVLRERALPLEQAGLNVEVRMPTGEPYQEILALAAEMHVDGILCGTHGGKTGIGQLLVGSISERLIHESHVPVLLARFDVLRRIGDPAELLRAFCRNVVLPTDFSEGATRALRAVLDLPGECVGRLNVVHVLDAESAKSETVRDGARFQLDTLAALAREQGVETASSVTEGEPPEAVLAEVRRLGATGAIVGTRGLGVIGDALLGSVSTELLRHSPCPVLVVP